MYPVGEGESDKKKQLIQKLDEILEFLKEYKEPIKMK